MTLAMGIVAAIALLILIAVRLDDLAQMVRTLRRGRAPAAVPGPPRAIDPQTQARLTALAGQGNKIQAIKDLRAATGVGLKEAKDAVDALLAGHDNSAALPPRRDIPAATRERARELIARGEHDPGDQADPRGDGAGSQGGQGRR
jgi:ribosomal protein L7/L12